MSGHSPRCRGLHVWTSLLLALFTPGQSHSAVHSRGPRLTAHFSGWRPDRPDRSVPCARRASARRRSSLSTAGGTPREIRGEQLVGCQYFVSDIAERRSHPDLRARDRSPQLTTLSRALGLEEDSRVEAFTCPSASVLFHLDSLHPTSTSGRSALGPLGQDLTRLWKRHFCIKFSSGWVIWSGQNMMDDHFYISRWLLRLYFGC